MKPWRMKVGGQRFHYAKEEMQTIEQEKAFKLEAFRA